MIQADISHCGGIGELLRIASFAEVYNVQVDPHNPYRPVALAAAAHGCLCMLNFLILEHCRHRPWFDKVQKFEPIVRDGQISLSDHPGLGIELDWDYVNKHPYQRLPMRIFTDEAGSVSLI